MRLKTKLKLIGEYFFFLFVRCKKCNGWINPKLGYWHYWGTYPMIKGFYHGHCGVTEYNFDSSAMPFTNQYDQGEIGRT